MKIRTVVTNSFNLLAGCVLASALISAPLAASTLSFTFLVNELNTYTGTLTGEFSQVDSNVFLATGVDSIALNGNTVPAGGGWYIGDLQYIFSSGETGQAVATVTLDGTSMSLGILNDVTIPTYLVIGTRDLSPTLETDMWITRLLDTSIGNGPYNPEQWSASSAPEPATWILLGAGMCLGVIRSRRYTSATKHLDR